MVVLLGIGAITSELVVIYAAGLSMLAMLVAWLGFRFLPKRFQQPALPLLMFLVVGFILHGPFTGIAKASVDLPPEEQALLTMVKELPVGARVLAGSPGVVYAANMTYMGLSSTDVPIFSTVQDFQKWLNSQNIEAVYIDQSLTIDNSAYWVLLQELAYLYRVVYTDPSGIIQVWILSDL